MSLTPATDDEGTAWLGAMPAPAQPATATTIGVSCIECGQQIGYCDDGQSIPDITCYECTWNEDCDDCGGSGESDEDAGDDGDAACQTCDGTGWAA